MAVMSGNKTNLLKDETDRSHVPVFPLWLSGIRIIQFVSVKVTSHMSGRTGLWQQILNEGPSLMVLRYRCSQQCYYSGLLGPSLADM
ncbi:hypothetical protein CCHR01_07115 [Colletotrichum chrysophilum]|uniref:Uncharacterized protein n=1 Tax=Colletotrichum chrysophilum TaxID=1836956 RepID=A0AAD9AP72_9PEZI|nr:hypothetical protein CCHR01_07115 [Colletotrichum chrysophilum]